MLRPFRHLFRLVAIALVLLRYDVFMLRKSGLRQGERLAHALEKLGPAFIKFGQAVSTRSDFIGEDVAGDLARLRDDLPPFPTVQARAIIEAEFGQKIDALFAHFADTPVAAASIAQVHKATTKDGKNVAVKITRPGIEKAFARDIALLFWLAETMENHLPKYRRLKPREIVQTFKDTVFFELDLRFEAAAAEDETPQEASPSATLSSGTPVRLRATDSISSTKRC